MAQEEHSWLCACGEQTGNALVHITPPYRPVPIAPAASLGLRNVSALDAALLQPSPSPEVKE